GLTDEDYAAIQNVRRWQANSVSQITDILSSGVEAAVENVISTSFGWLSHTALQTVGNVSQQLIGHYLTQSGTQAMLAKALSEISRGIPDESLPFYKSVFNTVLGLYI